MRDRFTITNIDPAGYRFIRRFSVISFMLVGVFVLIAGRIDKLDNYWKIPFALLIMILGIILPLVSRCAAKTQVQFDGRYISHRCPLRNIRIDLQEVKSVDCRGECGAVYIDFLFFDESTITFTDSGVPLLLLYDDIINAYPDKTVRK